MQVEQAIAGSLRDSGPGAGPVPHLHLPALLLPSGKMTCTAGCFSPPAHVDGIATAAVTWK
jgi:hypothetical protein